MPRTRRAPRPPLGSPRSLKRNERRNGFKVIHPNPDNEHAQVQELSLDVVDETRETLRRWLAERPHLKSLVDIARCIVGQEGSVCFPLQGMWPAEPQLDQSPYGQVLEGDGEILYHGCAPTRLQAILSSTRLVRGHRAAAGKYGVFAAKGFGQALLYAPPGHLTTRAGEGPMQCVFKLRAFRRSRVKQLAGFQYILRENWVQLEALLVKPWTQGPLTVNPKLFYTRLDDMELPPNDPVQNRPFFCTWEKAPQDFVDAPNASLERKRPAQRPEPKVVLAAAPPKAELTASSPAPSPRFTSSDEVKARVSEFHKAAATSSSGHSQPVAEPQPQQTLQPDMSQAVEECNFHSQPVAEPHTQQTLQPDMIQAVEECNFFVRTGRCHFGDKCKFRHPTHEEKLAEFLVKRKSKPPDAHEVKPWRKSAKPRLGGACQLSPPPSRTPSQTAADTDFFLFFHRADQLESKSRTPSKTGADPPTPPISFRMWREKFVGTVDCPEKILLFQLVPMETV